MDANVRVTRLENGLQVVTEAMHDVASVALGLWVENGSRFESAELNGVSHFVEHLVFKGTDRRSPRRIAEEIESLGGSINAFTGKEYTCYHTRTLHEHLDVSFDVLSDLVLGPVFRPEDVELEREVIIQEILDVEDSPEEFIYDYYLSSYWPGHPLGRPIAGTVDSVGAMTRDQIVEFMRRRYSPERYIVAAAGRVDHDELVDLCRKAFDMPASAGEPASADDPNRADRPDFNPGVFIAQRDLEQVHLVVGMPGLSVMDERREHGEILLAALGGGMSSRLFQSIREDRGKAYSVYAFQSPFRDIGYTGVYAATGQDSVEEVLDLIHAELHSVTEHGLAPAELERTRNQLVAGIPLALETSESRMFRLGRNQMYFGRPLTIEEVVEDIRSVTNEQLIELARELFNTDRTALALVGDVDENSVRLPAAH